MADRLLVGRFCGETTALCPAFSILMERMGAPALRGFCEGWNLVDRSIGSSGDRVICRNYFSHSLQEYNLSL